MGSRWLLALVMIVLGCSAAVLRAPGPERFALPVPPATRLVLVTLDGVRWQDTFGAHARELLPNLYGRVIDRGVALGAATPLSASGPNFVSLPGYRELLSGRADRD